MNVIYDKSKFFSFYIKSGKGIEIGALHASLPVPDGVEVLYVDRFPEEKLKEHYKEHADKIIKVDVVDDGETLSAFDDAGQDFIIASHFFEHCRNPLRALSNMLRVLKKEGILFLAVPDKRFTFDRDRPVTPLKHLLEDYKQEDSVEIKEHFADHVLNIEKITDPEAAARRIMELMEMDYSIHYHVWTQHEMLEIFLSLSKVFGFEFEAVLRSGMEMVFILRKII